MSLVVPLNDQRRLAVNDPRMENVNLENAIEIVQIGAVHRPQLRQLLVISHLALGHACWLSRTR